MNRTILFLTTLIMAITTMAQTEINMTIGTTTVTVSLESNSATAALLTHLRQGDVTVSTTRYGGFEQVGRFPWSLPTSNTQITTQPGDVILYSGNQLVVFFGSNSWSYTRLGRIEELSSSELTTLLNVASCDITLSLPSTTGIKKAQATSSLDPSKPMYDLHGQRVSPSFRGTVIQNGRIYKKQ